MKILKTSVVFILVFFLVVTIYLVLITKKDGVLKYSNDEYGISFVYPKGYVLEERNFPGSDMRKHHGIVLTLEKDLPPPVQGEGPVSINIDIYQNNLDSQTAEQWIRNSSDSNLKLGDGKSFYFGLGGGIQIPLAESFGIGPDISYRHLTAGSGGDQLSMSVLGSFNF
jgi:hypothetical protein